MEPSNRSGTSRLWRTVIALLFFACPPLSAQETRGDSTGAQRNGTQPKFAGEVSFGGSATRSTVDSEKIKAGLSFDVEFNPETTGPRHQFSTIEVAGSYESTKKGDARATLVRSYTGWLQHLVFVHGNNWFVSGNARFLHNNSLGVYLQQRYSALAGYIVRSNGRVVELNVGPAFVGQHFLTAQPSTGFAAAELRESVSLPLRFITNETRLSETIRLVAPFNPGDPKIREGDAQLFIPITSAITFNVGALNYYISNPPSGFDKNYLTTSLGFTVSLGK